jgi:hypothetical protein
MARKPEPPKAPPLRYRKKPIVIEAWQYARHNDFSHRPEWFAEAVAARAIVIGGSVIVIQTSEGAMTAQTGDWIIRGIKGELYPCKPDIFAATYEAVEP